MDAANHDLNVFPTDEDRRLLALLDDLPLEARPWRTLAQEVGRSEADVLAKVREWSRGGIFRFLRPFFNAQRMGYQSTLIAGQIDREGVDEVGNAIAESPYVSHDFLRTGGDFNLWFTLTCPMKGPTIPQTIQELGTRMGVSFRRFDTVRHFKISFRNLMSGTQKAAGEERLDEPAEVPEDVLRRAIDAVQCDFPLTDRPFAALAEGNAMSEVELLQALRFLKHRKILRRLGVVLNFKCLGINQNVMCVWDAPEKILGAFGQAAAGHPRVSHCYQRTHYPDWPWKIYTVIHGRDADECLRLIDEIGEGFPSVRRLALWTTREYKQSPIRYDVAKVHLAP